MLDDIAAWLRACPCRPETGPYPAYTFTRSEPPDSVSIYSPCRFVHGFVCWMGAELYEVRTTSMISEALGPDAG